MDMPYGNLLTQESNSLMLIRQHDNTAVAVIGDSQINVTITIPVTGS